ncbi:MAG: TIGR01897 family CRISPR-associated protein [Thermoproteota archaeon]|nr:MAG: TIGR01897 family CRISPR-associated protein [Candidatus Korarchaeota archaeon]
MSQFPVRILIAPWGNPFSWREAIYRLSESDRRVKGVTSTSLLAKELSPDLIIVSVPETLLSVRKLEEYGGKIISGNEDYKELIYGLKLAIERFFRENVGEFRMKVVVAPNVGEYGGIRWILPERISPDSAYAAYILASLILNTEEDVEIHLDTTHGVNFMPLAVYRAVLAASRIISAMNNVRIKFSQYNSTPYPAHDRAEGIPELEVFKVKEEFITPVKAAQRLVYSYLSRDEIRIFRYAISSRDLGDSHKILEERARKLHREAGPVASSVHYSMPLAFLQFSEIAEGGIDGLEELMEEIISCVEVKREGRITVKHLILPSYEDLKSFLSALSLISYGKNCISSIDGMRVEEGIVEARIDALSKAMEYLKGPLAEVAKNEIYSFREHLNELAEEALKRKGEWVSMDGCEESRRIMIAHAGLAKRAIELKIDENIWFRYKKECLQRTEDVIRGILNDTRQMVKGEEW